MNKNPLSLLIYSGLTRFLSPTLISVFIGIFSGISVNLFTNQSTNRYYYLAIFSLCVAILFLICLIILNGKYQSQYDSQKSANPTFSNMTNWHRAIYDKPFWKHYFYLFTISSVLYIALALLSITQGNIISGHENHMQEYRIKHEITLLSDSLAALKKSMHHFTNSSRKIENHIEEGNKKIR